MEEKYQRPQSDVKCCYCNTTFKKDNSEIIRNNKLGREHYCSLKCIHSGKVTNPNGNPKNLNSNNRVDKYTGLREHLSRAKKRFKEVTITLEDLLEVWNNQDGICKYTGLKLLHPKDSKGYSMMYKASLDRVDSSLGYIKGNIQFISATANLAKGTMTHEGMLTFCKIITEHWK